MKFRPALLKPFERMDMKSRKHASARSCAMTAAAIVVALSAPASLRAQGTGSANVPFTSEGSVSEVLARPPHAKTVPAGNKPLIVMTGFLARSDSSPLSQRGRDPNNLVDRTGKPIADPAADPSANALDSDPNLLWEKWDEYWRKVHGVRFTYAEDASDTTLNALMRYDQIHRLPAGPTQSNPPPYRAPADAAGKLYPGVIGHIPDYKRPRWDGIAYLNFRSADDIGGVFGEKFKTKLLPEDAVLFRQVAPVLSRQYIRIASKDSRDPVILVYTHARRAGTTREQFQKEWLGRHHQLVMSQASTKSLVSRYVQLQNIGGAEPGQPFYAEATAGIDAISLMYFRSMNDVEDYLMSPGFKTIANDLQRIADPAKSDFWTAIDYVVINRFGKEQPTR